MNLSTKFESRAPHPQNAVDIFRERWASDLSGLIPGVQAGTADLFVADERPLQAARMLGANGRLDGMAILELGPLEAGHTYQLEKLGAASVYAVEANSEAYLKCLIVKEILQLQRSHFVYGDFTEYLKAGTERYDMIFASGVLYHMQEPVELLKLMAARAEKAFIWTHYFDPANYPGPQRTPVASSHFGRQITHHHLAYPDAEQGKFWGGNKAGAAWLERDDLLYVLQQLFRHVSLIADEPTHPHGSSIKLAVHQ